MDDDAGLAAVLGELRVAGAKVARDGEAAGLPAHGPELLDLAREAADSRHFLRALDGVAAGGGDACRSLSSDDWCSSVSMSGAPFRRYSTVRESPTLATWSVLPTSRQMAHSPSADPLARRVVREPPSSRRRAAGSRSKTRTTCRCWPERRRLAAEAVVHRPERAAHVVAASEVGDDRVTARCPPAAGGRRRSARRADGTSAVDGRPLWMVLAHRRARRTSRWRSGGVRRIAPAARAERRRGCACAAPVPRTKAATVSRRSDAAVQQVGLCNPGWLSFAQLFEESAAPRQGFGDDWERASSLGTPSTSNGPQRGDESTPLAERVHGVPEHRGRRWRWSRRRWSRRRRRRRRTPKSSARSTPPSSTRRRRCC